LRFLNSEQLPLGDFIKQNEELIYRVSKESKGQGNSPGRALPIMEILKVKFGTSPVAIIELGASHGIIGRCLLYPEILLSGKEKYFSRQQQMPLCPHGIDHYLGIELFPPSIPWLLAWEWHPQRLRNLLRDLPEPGNFQLLAADAFGFSKIGEVEYFSSRFANIVILTSFMMYQFSPERQSFLKDEILDFTKRQGHHWLNLALDVQTMGSYIDYDEERLMVLADSSCKSWQWLNR